MNENAAIDLALRVYNKHILPTETYAERELVVIQVIADLYKAGYELVPKTVPKITLGEIEQMKEDGVVY